MQVDKETRFDSISTDGEKSLTYYYSLFDLEILEMNITTMHEYIGPAIIKNVKTDPSLQIYRDNQVTMNYRYYDKNKVFITEISVTPDQYTGIDSTK